MPDEREKIDQFIAERGVTTIPSAAAVALGESTPGWRREAERRADRAYDFVHNSKKDGQWAIHDSIANRIGAPIFVPGHKRPAKRVRRAKFWAMCRFFDKYCAVFSSPSFQRASADVARIQQFYARSGARFTIVETVSCPPTFSEWRQVRAMLERQINRQGGA